MMFRLLIAVILNLGLCGPAFAEYRVFELAITDPDTNKTRTVISTLDPFQYASYYHVLERESVLYTNTWMCFGSTSKYKKPCPDPSRQPSNVKTPTAK